MSEDRIYDWRYHFTWKGRIGRREFAIAQQVMGLAALAATAPMIVLTMFWSNPGAGFAVILFVIAVLHVPGSSVLVRRAHDLGWPAAIPLALMFLQIALVLVLVAGVGAFGRAIADAPVVRTLSGVPSLIICLLCASVSAAWFSFARGKPEANRYGPPSESG
jgi:uncharacterized membrane protein YhaH (DUF805 family)